MEYPTPKPIDKFTTQELEPSTDLEPELWLVREELIEKDLVKLIAGESLAIRIPYYYPETLSQQISQRLIEHPLFGHYENAPDIGRVGTAYYETVGNPELRRLYYAQALKSIQALREACAPFQSPMDLLRLDVQERWTYGATLANIEGAPMFVGLARVFEEGAEALPHQDILRRDAPHSPMAYTLMTQIAANVYLQPAPQGGELEIWARRLTDEEYEALRLDNSYGLDRNRLPESNLVISPQVGELVLFDSTHLHAVRTAKGGSRITLSCFIGYRGPGQPLLFWS